MDHLELGGSTPSDSGRGTTAIYLDTARRRILTDLVVHVSDGSGPLFLVGASGLGKTTLLRRVAAEVLAQDLPFTFLANAAAATTALLAVFDACRKQLPQADSTAAAAATGGEGSGRAPVNTDRPAALLIDDAETCPIAVWQQLAALPASGAAGLPAVIFTMRPETFAWLTKIALFRVEAPDDRVRYLEPLAPPDIARFLTHQLKGHGELRRDLLPPQAIERIAAATDGVPGRLADFCDKMLAMPSIRGAVWISTETISTIIMTLTNPAAGAAEAEPTEVAMPQPEEVAAPPSAPIGVAIDPTPAAHRLAMQSAAATADGVTPPPWQVPHPFAASPTQPRTGTLFQPRRRRRRRKALVIGSFIGVSAVAALVTLVVVSTRRHDDITATRAPTANHSAIGSSSAARSPTAPVQTPAIQAPAIQAPAIQAPAIQTPAIQTPAVQAPAQPTLPAATTDSLRLAHELPFGRSSGTTEEDQVPPPASLLPPSLPPATAVTKSTTVAPPPTGTGSKRFAATAPTDRERAPSAASATSMGDKPPTPAKRPSVAAAEKTGDKVVAAATPQRPTAGKPPAKPAKAAAVDAPAAAAAATNDQGGEAAGAPLPPRPVGEIIALGDEFRSSGDVSWARKFYQAAQDRGSAKGAAALASTYDPRFVDGSNHPDPQRARQLYEEAARHGDRTAAKQLEDLDHWLDEAH